MNPQTIQQHRRELHHHLTQQLLPFWVSRTADHINGGFITHFDQHGHDSGTDEKSLISQTRSVYTYASAHRAGYGHGSDLADLARHGVTDLTDRATSMLPALVPAATAGLAAFAAAVRRRG